MVGGCMAMVVVELVILDQVSSGVWWFLCSRMMMMMMIDEDEDEDEDGAVGQGWG